VRVVGRRVEQVALGADAVATLMTIASRIGSIGGLVTCAKSCLK
jgi:translation initiation factor 2B subunit (eIF-2B alpha/beta/delta family)